MLFAELKEEKPLAAIVFFYFIEPTVLWKETSLSVNVFRSGNQIQN